MDIHSLQTRLRAFSAERGWEPHQNPKNLAMAMVVEAAELVEIFQWLSPAQAADLASDAARQQHAGEEIADVLVYLLQIADRCGIDVEAAVERKMALNALKYPVPTALSTAAQQVAVIDWRAVDAPARFVHSLLHTGFAVLTHHPIDTALLRRIEDEWDAWLASPAVDNCRFDPLTQDGYVGPERSETAKGQTEKDLKAFFHHYPGGRYPQELSDAALRYRAQAEALAAQLLDWVQQHAPEAARQSFPQPLPEMIAGSRQTLLRILRYPPLRGDEPAGAMRAAAHEDINLLTVLPAAREPGLQVLGRDGLWRDVPGDAGWLVVNTGDMLQEASGGVFPSTTHRVVNPAGEAARRARLAMPLFLHPRPEVRLSARHTAASYLDERLRELGLRAP
ncbi:Isopenicillin N synthase [Sphaerotilus natans]|nr:2OG-Fe(II) oxygenase family protein [Sphaerotilus natans]SIR38078.1 Isopenicillin N synthase [Sphaerotilus natans]